MCHTPLLHLYLTPKQHHFIIWLYLYYSYHSYFLFFIVAFSFFPFFLPLFCAFLSSYFSPSPLFPTITPNFLNPHSVVYLRIVAWRPIATLMVYLALPFLPILNNCFPHIRNRTETQYAYFLYYICSFLRLVPFTCSLFLFMLLLPYDKNPV